MTHALDSAFAKLDRAHEHLDALKASIEIFRRDERHTPTFRKEFDAQANCFTVYYDTVPDLPPHWSLIIGDAVHNFRSSLDHLAWQLACRHLGGEPQDERIIRKIQFPILSDPGKWPPVVLKYIDSTHHAALESYQPYKGRTQAGFHVLEALADLSNKDKHRAVHPVLIANKQITVAIPCVDCVQREVEIVNLMRMEPDEVAMKVFVVPTGPNPDIQIKVNGSAYIGFSETGWDAYGTLDSIGIAVAAALSEFEPVF